MQVLSFLDALTYFLELNHYSGAAESVLHQRLKILVSSRLPVEMEMCADAAQLLKGSSNCIKQNITGEGKQVLHEMIKCWRKKASITENDRRLAKKKQVLQEMIDYW